MITHTCVLYMYSHSIRDWKYWRRRTWEKAKNDFQYIHLLFVVKPPFKCQILSLILVHCPLQTKLQSYANATFRELVFLELWQVDYYLRFHKEVRFLRLHQLVTLTTYSGVFLASLSNDTTHSNLWYDDFSKSCFPYSWKSRSWNRAYTSGFHIVCIGKVHLPFTKACGETIFVFIWYAICTTLDVIYKSEI